MDVWVNAFFNLTNINLALRVKKARFRALFLYKRVRLVMLDLGDIQHK